MHDAIKAAIGVDLANCQTCSYLGSDGDGYEYNGSWPVCNKHDKYSHLNSFPFKKEMKCWYPEFWHSKFAGEIKTGEHEEVMALCEQFREAVNRAKSLELVEG